MTGRDMFAVTFGTARMSELSRFRLPEVHFHRQGHACGNSCVWDMRRSPRSRLSIGRKITRRDMKIVSDEEKCVAAGQCVSAAWEVFDQRDEDGIVVLLNPSP